MSSTTSHHFLHVPRTFRSLLLSLSIINMSVREFQSPKRYPRLPFCRFITALLQEMFKIIGALPLRHLGLIQKRRPFEFEDIAHLDVLFITLLFCLLIRLIYHKYYYRSSVIDFLLIFLYRFFCILFWIIRLTSLSLRSSLKCTDSPSPAVRFLR